MKKLLNKEIKRGGIETIVGVVILIGLVVVLLVTVVLPMVATTRNAGADAQGNLTTLEAAI